MADLTPEQAISAARELYHDAFSGHRSLLFWRQIRRRRFPPNLKALGLDPAIHQIISFQTDQPEQEAHRYANAFSAPEPEIAVFTRDETVRAQKIAEEHLEPFYDAVVRSLLIEDEYLRCLHMAAEGFGVGKLSLKPAFYRHIPERGPEESYESYNERVDAQRKLAQLPFCFETVDPATFVYEENKERKLTLAVEWGEQSASVLEQVYDQRGIDPWLGPTVPEGEATWSGRRVHIVVLRSRDVCYHILMGSKESRRKTREDRVLWEGPNPFSPSTGYILWRGLDSGDSDPAERYVPFIINTLNKAPLWNLLYTLHTNMVVQSQKYWFEFKPETQEPLPGRRIELEAKAGAKLRRGQGPEAQLAPGTTVRWRDVPAWIERTMDRLEVIEERYRFPEALAPDSSTGESGRDTIRRQEVATKLLRPGFEARRRAVLETLHIIRHCIFSKPEYLADGRAIYVTHQIEGVGDHETARREQLIAISEQDNIPHEIDVTIATESMAAQLALYEEGAKMEGRLSRDTVDRVFYRVKNLPLENRRRQKDLIRAATYPVTVQKALEAVNQRLEQRLPATSPEIVLPNQPSFSPPPGKLDGGRVSNPAASAQPASPVPEDTGSEGLPIS